MIRLLRSGSLFNLARSPPACKPKDAMAWESHRLAAYPHVITSFNLALILLGHVRVRKGILMLIKLNSEKISSIEVTTQDELRMVFETLGELPQHIPTQLEIPYGDEQLEKTSELPKHQVLISKLKELYNSLSDENSHRKVLQALAQTEMEIDNQKFKVILGYKKNHQVAAIMGSLSRKAKKHEVDFKAIILSAKIVTPEGSVQTYKLSTPMREAMKELGFTSRKGELATYG